MAIRRESQDVATNVELVKSGHAVGFRLLWFIGRDSPTLQPHEEEKPGKSRVMRWIQGGSFPVCIWHGSAMGRGLPAFYFAG